MTALPITNDPTPPAFDIDGAGFFDPAFFDPAFFDTGGPVLFTLTGSSAPPALVIDA